jgi:uncharacterized protein (TIGR03545 family)
MKVPKLFPVEIAERVFQTRILKRIHTVGDREYVETLYPPAKDRTRRRKADLGEQDLRRLAGLAKSIAANRGVVQVPKLIILGVILAAAIVFNLAFKNTLLTRALVAGLEGVFGARAEVAGLNFRLLGGSIAIDTIAVADRDRPMRNLFELGTTELAVDVFRLIEGSVIIRNVECRDVRWDTPRTSSGALAATGSDGSTATDEAQSGDAVGGAGVLEAAKGFVDDLDIPGLVDREVGTLASPKRIEESNAKLTRTADAWAARLEKDRTDVETLAAQVEEIRTFDYASIKTAKDAQRLVDAIAAAAPRVKSFTKELEAASRDLVADSRQVTAEQAALRGAIAADVASLQKKLDLSPARWKGLAAKLADRALERYLGTFARYARKAWDAGVNLVRRSREGAPKAKPLARAGRTVVFTGAGRPGFHLVNAAFSSAMRTDFPGLEATLVDITSDPDLVGRPAVLAASAAADSMRISLSVTMDARTGAPLPISAKLSAENVAIALREGLEVAGLASLSGTATLRTDLAFSAGGAASGSGSLTVRDTAIVAVASDDPVAKTVAEVLRAVPTATADFTYTIAPGTAPALAIRTNLDEVLAGKIREQLDRVATKARGAIEEEVWRRLEGGMGETADIARRYAELQGSAGTDLARTKGFATVLADAQKELEKRLKAAIPLPKLTF